MNYCCVVGRLTNDVELRYTTQNTAVAKGSIAVKRNYKNKDGVYETDFFNFSMFGAMAETTAKYCQKGDMIGLKGRMKSGSYEKDGIKFNTFEITVENATFLSTKKVEQPKEQPKEEKSDPFKEFADELELDESDLPF